MQPTPIQQGTEEWLNAKLQTVGGSEIYALVLGLCTTEEIKAVLPNYEPEISYTSPLLIGLKFLYGQTTKIHEINKLYGNAMEKPSVDWFNEERKGVAKCEFTRNFHIHEKYKQASCSPDGYISLNGKIQDFSTNEDITVENGLGLMEIKTARRQAGFQEEPALQYLFQASWNAYVIGLSWFCVFITFAKEYDYESELHKGKRIAYAELGLLEKIRAELDCKTFFYKQNNGIINLCLLALRRFTEKIIKSKNLEYSKKWIVFDFTTNNEKIFIQEKSIIGNLADSELQSQYGNRETIENEAEMLEKRYKLILQKKEIDSEINEIEGYFYKVIQDNSQVIAHAGEDYEMSVLPKEGGLKFTPTLAKKSLVEYLTKPKID